jgi:hypothetical protein
MATRQSRGKLGRKQRADRQRTYFVGDPNPRKIRVKRDLGALRNVAFHRDRGGGLHKLSRKRAF